MHHLSIPLLDEQQVKIMYNSINTVKETNFPPKNHLDVMSTSYNFTVKKYYLQYMKYELSILTCIVICKFLGILHVFHLYICSVLLMVTL